eukprot:symbB.v1.2.005585.t5/scaffold326.1/size228935/7
MILVLAWSRQAMSDALGGIKLFFSGALLVRLQIPPIEGKMQQNSSRGDEFSAHVDKANVASYDWSALLYLSTVGEDFEGGELLFLDDDIDSQLAPKAGQLVFFSSGLENVHRVRPMTFGRRLVLAMWFTCSRRHRVLCRDGAGGKGDRPKGDKGGKGGRKGKGPEDGKGGKSSGGMNPKGAGRGGFGWGLNRALSFGQKTWQSKSEKTHAKSDNGVEQNDKEYKESRRAELPERTEKKEVRRNETIESVKDSDDSKDPKVEGKGVPEKPTDEAASGLKGRFGKLSLSEGKSEEASDNWSLQPDYMYDPGWFAWNTEMAWAFGAEASDEWQGKFPWEDWEKKENPTNSADPETSEQLASEWERPTAPGFGSFGKRHELVPKKANLKEQFEKTESKSVTTLMLRNVPNAYDRETLMEELDQLGFAGCFNFLYLPIDSATKNNVGYAFVNFNDEKMSEDCMNNMTGYFFKGQPYNRRRAAIVSVAHLQGLEANLEHYSRTQVFFAPLPCQRPWVAPSAAKELLERGCVWAPLGFDKLVEDAAARPGNKQDDQSFFRFRRFREQWWGNGFDGCFDPQAYEMMYGYYFGFDGIPPELLEEHFNNGLIAQYHQPGQVLREEPEAEGKDGQDKAGDLVNALSKMLRTGSQQVPVDDEEEHELSMMGQLEQMKSMGWFGWEFFDGMERSCSLAMKSSASAPSDDPPSSTDGCLVLLNVPLATTEWDLRQIIEHVGVHSPITVRFEPGASQEINKVTLHFKNQIDLEIADVTLRETSWNTEDGGARIQIYRSEQSDGGSMWPGYPAAMPARSAWDFSRDGNGSSWFFPKIKMEILSRRVRSHPIRQLVVPVLPEDSDDER